MSNRNATLTFTHMFSLTRIIIVFIFIVVYFNIFYTTHGGSMLTTVIKHCYLYGYLLATVAIAETMTQSTSGSTS